MWKKDGGKSNLKVKDRLFTTEYSEDIPWNQCQSLGAKGAVFSVMCPCIKHGHKMTWDHGGGNVETRSRSSGVCRAANFGVVVDYLEQLLL